MSRIKCALNQAKTSLFSRLQLECIKFYQSQSTTAECWTSQINQFILDALLNNNLVLVTPSGSEHINISLQQRYLLTLDLLRMIRKPLLSTWISSGQRLLSLEVPNVLPISHHIRLLLIFLYYLSKKLRLNQAINQTSTTPKIFKAFDISKILTSTGYSQQNLYRLTGLQEKLMRFCHMQAVCLELSSQFQPFL